MPIVAPLIGAAVGIGGSLISAGAAKSAGNQAAAAQQYAADQAVGEQRRQFDITQQNFAPWLETGKQALDAQSALLGLPGIISGYGGGTFDINGNQVTPADRQNDAISQLQQSPLYQSLYRNGQNTILANGAATGGLRGGNIQNSLANFGADTLAQVIQTQLANLGGIAGQGQGAAGSLGVAGTNAANQISSAYGDAGAAQAAAYLNAGKANVGNINNISGTLGGLVGNTGIQTALGKLF